MLLLRNSKLIFKVDSICFYFALLGYAWHFNILPGGWSKQLGNIIMRYSIDVSWHCLKLQVQENLLRVYVTCSMLSRGPRGVSPYVRVPRHRRRRARLCEILNVAFPELAGNDPFIMRGWSVKWSIWMARSPSPLLFSQLSDKIGCRHKYAVRESSNKG